MFEEYSPERVRLQANGPGYLLLTDAYYPGWVAKIDGQATPILRADLMFRAACRLHAQPPPDASPEDLRLWTGQLMSLWRAWHAGAFTIDRVLARAP